MAEKTVKEQKSRESKLTVKPIRFQLEQPKHSLKKTFNIEIRANNVLPLETQIAGHGSENDGQRCAEGFLIVNERFLIVYEFSLILYIPPS